MQKPLIIFGASFNPPTLAHRAMIDYLAKANPEASIMLVPVYQHRFQNKSDLLDYAHRLEMTRLAFPDYTISDLEKTLAQPEADFGTVDLLKYLKRDHDQVSLVLGADAYNDLMSGKWKSADKILEMVEKIYVFERDGIELKATHHPCVEIIKDLEIPAISSTKVRANKDFARSAVDLKVFDYIVKNGLYR